jgi:hypothetical protein
MLPRLLLLLLALLGVLGCEASPLEIEPWPDGPRNGKIVKADRYDIHTTLRDTEKLMAVRRTLNETGPLYRRLADQAYDETGRYDAFVFAYREEWADHTRQTQGDRARLYLQIQRGGFASDGDFSTFFSGSLPQMLKTIRHEGLHQHFELSYQRRPPPFVEEGLATLFEEGFEENDLKEPRPSFMRIKRLRESVRRQRLWPLDELLRIDAGHVVGAGDYRQVGTFYAQAWAFASMLASEPDLHEGLQRYLAAYADGTASRDPRLALQEAFEMSFDELSARFEEFTRDITETS